MQSIQSIKSWLAPTLGGLLAAIICLYFYDQFWWPPDDGAYAFIADQILKGKILHKEVQDLHMGYINLLNAGSLAVFGNNFLSLRYPLVLATIIQSSFICYLLRSYHPIIIISSALAISSLTFIQFINPTANWYALLLTVLIIAFLQSAYFKKKPGLKLISVGFLIGNLFLFRQLSAIFVAMACISYLHYEYQTNSQRTSFTKTSKLNTILSKILLLSMLAGLTLYLGLKVNLTAILLFGIFPILLILHQIQFSKVPNSIIIYQSKYLLAGFLLSIAPIVTYHAWQNSLTEWLLDTVITANSLTQLQFFRNASYITIAIESFGNIFSGSPVLIINGIYWTLLLLLPSCYGFLLYREVKTGAIKVPPVAYIPLFYGLVSAHYEIPIYLYYTIALVLIATTVLLAEKKRLSAITLTSFFLSFTALTFHAAQPLTRGLAGTIQGETIAHNEKCRIERCGVNGDSKTIDKYKALITEIKRLSKDTDYILALPFNPEIYYLSQQSPPVTYYNSAFGLNDMEALIETEQRILATKTKLLIVNENDKYYTELSRKLVNRLSNSDYLKVTSIDEFTLFQLRDSM